DQRRLAGAVLAEQRMDRARHQRQRHIVQRLHAGEALRGVADFERAHAFAFATRISRNRLMPTAQRIRAPSTICTTKGSIANRTSAWVMMAMITTPKKVPA